VCTNRLRIRFQLMPVILASIASVRLSPIPKLCNAACRRPLRSISGPLVNLAERQLSQNCPISQQQPSTGVRVNGSGILFADLRRS
ncbi:MAG: hypothetical protein WBM41_05265, partial [Arenicellales bacterium]